MDDIAKHLGMSKKTIYQHYSDKDELVNILIAEKLENQECAMSNCAVQAENAVQELFITINSMHDLLSNMNPKLFYDLQKYHPKAWLSFKSFKEKNIGDCIRLNLERGVREGIYREEINVEILTQMRLEQVDLLFSYNNQAILSKYNLVQVMTEITSHFLHGICNSKGLEIIENYKQTLHA